MSLQPVTESASYGPPIWQTGRVPETAQGGFILDITGLTEGETLKGGTVMTFDESTRLAKKATATPADEGAGTPASSDAKGLLYSDVKIAEGADVAIVVRGTVYERRIPAVDDIHKAALPLIVFSNSY